MILNTELDPCVAYGFTGGPEFSTRVVNLKNGHERRNANWSNARHRYTAPFQNIRPEAYNEIKRVFNACRGMLHGFLFEDPFDHTATLASLGAAPSGTTPVQLVTTSTADFVTYTRTITRPQAGAVVFQNGIPKAGSLDLDTGVFTPTTSWTPGAALAWTGEFYVPVRFANDWLPFSWDNLNHVNGEVEIVEVFGE